jgi:drug/metabolite transporter (DMT)-like permease
VSGIPAALSASLLWGTADFLAGRASRRHPVVLVALVGQAAGLLVLACILAIRGLDTAALVPGALSGAVGVVAVTAFYAALGLGTMSIVAPIGATSAIVPVIAGIVDGERPGALQWTGVAVALTGVVLAAREPSGGTSRDARAAVRLALLAALTIGFALVFLDKAAEHDALSGVAAARAVSVPALVAALLWTRRRATAPAPLPRAPRLLAGLAAIGLLDTAANAAFAIATTGGLLSLVAVLGGLFPVVTVALAYFVLGERLAPLQRAGVALALVGVPLIGAG